MSAGDFTESLQVGENAAQARIYNSRIGRFVQPDTIIPGANNPQAFNRYAYVLNNPANFVDLSGHVPQCTDDGYCPKNWSSFNYKTYASGAIRRELEQTYSVRILGTVTYSEANVLKDAFAKMAKFAGGEEEFNETIKAGLKAIGAKNNVLIIENVLTDAGHNACGGVQSAACWHRNQGKITLSDEVFASERYHQVRHRPYEYFGNTFTLALGAQVTIVHEVGHFLADLVPASVAVYENSVSNPNRFGRYPEESMVNAYALLIVSGETTGGQFADQIAFARNYANFWSYTPPLKVDASRPGAGGH